MLVYAVNKQVVPLSMPERFRTEIAYFMTPTGEPGAPRLVEGEYWIRAEDVRRWLEELVIEVISPLDAESRAELELTEEHEAFLNWLQNNDIQHVRLEPRRS